MITTINELKRNDLAGAKELYRSTRARLGRPPRGEWVRSLILLQDDPAALLAWLSKEA